MLHQLWGAARGQYNSLGEDEDAGKWDDPIASSSALRARLMRALLDETALENGLQTSSNYFDLDRFYDSISLVKLAQLAVQMKYPAPAQSFSLQAYTGSSLPKALFEEPPVIKRQVSFDSRHVKL